MNHSLIRFATFVLCVLAFAGCRRPVEQTVRIAVDYPNADVDQLEREVAVPLEVALAGLPHMTHCFTICRKARVEVDLVFEDSVNLNDVNSRLSFVSGLPATASKPTPVVVTTVDPRRLPDALAETGNTLKALQIEADAAKLQAFGISADELHKVVFAECKKCGDVNDNMPDWRKTTINGSGGSVPIGDLAKVKIVAIPLTTVRHNGRRIYQMP